MRKTLVPLGSILSGPGGRIAAPVTRAIRAIEAVHQVPALRAPVPIIADWQMLEAGKYRWELATGLPVDIRLNPRCDHLELTTVLEVAHLLDHQVIGKPGEFASTEHPRLAAWRLEIDNTRSVRRLGDLRCAGSIPYRFKDGIVRMVNVEGTARALLMAPELFSRSYAQYIVTKSRDAALTHQIDGFVRPENPSSVVPLYWEPDEFAVIEDVLDRLIIELGWRK